MKYNTYYGVENWKIIAAKTFHFFDENETPLEAIQVVIGEVVNIIPDYKNNTKISTEITRWISRSEYERLCKGCGQVIW